MSYGRHRAQREPRWHDRPRAWLAAALHWLHRDWYEEDEELTDDHGNHIGGELPPVEYQRPLSAGELDPDAPWCPGCGFANYSVSPCEVCGYDDQDGEPPVIRTAKVSGVHLPLSGDNVNPWVNCAFTKDVPRADERPPGSEVAGPGYRQNVPRRGREVTAGRLSSDTRRRSEDRAAPGHLSMWDLVPVRSPWPPRPDDTVIISGPRVCARRIALLAGV